MSSYRFNERIDKPLLSAAAISTLTQCQAMTLTSASSVCFQFNYGAGLTATFQIMLSLDGVNWADSLAVIAPASGSAGSSLGNCDTGAAKYAMAQITPSAGSAVMTVLGRTATRP